MKPLIISTVVVACIGQAAFAQSIFDRCVSLLGEGRVDEAKPLASVIKNLSGIDSSSLDKAEQCLSEVYGIEHVYVPELKKIVTIVEANEFFGVQQQNIDRQQALIDLGKRKAAAASFTLETCTKIYRRSPEEAILQPVCNQVFLEFGLPR